MSQIDQDKKLFTNRQLLRLFWPLFIEQTLSILVGIADTVMVSHAGEAAISGVSLVDMINKLIINIFAAMATGGAVVVSQALGARDPRRARQAAGQLVTLACSIGLVIMVISLLFCRGLLGLFFGNVEADVMEAAVIYFLITALSFPFLALYNAGAALFRSIGNSAISMRISLLINLINVVGNAYCIIVLQMGVLGVAIPTLISRAVGAIVILCMASTARAQGLRLSGEYVRRWDRLLVRDILYIGIPSATENSLFTLGRVMVVSMISMHSTAHIAANAVANNLDSISTLVGQSMSLAMITVVGRCVGAQDFDQVRYYAKKLLLWCYVGQGTINLPLIAALPWILTFYNNLSPETVRVAIILVTIHAGCGTLLWPASFVLPNALRASNDVRFTMCTSIGSMAFWRIGLSYILCVRLGWGAIGVWWAMVADWIFRVICFVTRFVTGAWEKSALRAAAPKPQTP